MIHRVPSDFSKANWRLPDPGHEGALPAGQTGVVELVTTTAETRTLAAPTRPGIRLTLGFKTDGGDCVVTCATTINPTGNTVITFDTAGEMLDLISVPLDSAYRWRVVGGTATPS